MLRKLINLLPVSRGQYTKTLMELTTIIQGLIEAESNHCQIETNIIQQLQKMSTEKPQAKKGNFDKGTNMYG